MDTAMLPLDHETFLRRAFEVAQRARTHGNHPFGALLVDLSGSVLIEVENGYMPSHDGTAHAERLLATQACSTVAPDILRSATLYSSLANASACAMTSRSGFFWRSGASALWYQAVAA